MAAIDKDPLRDRLKKLSDGQFEELLDRLEVDASYLRLQRPRSETIIDLFAVLDQEDFGLVRLDRCLQDLGFFKQFVPKGTYPIGEGLKQREEERERRAGPVEPEAFYTFRAEAAWLGIFRDWDAPRSFREELTRAVIENARQNRNFPAGAIVGPGGSGKSVALRRLGLDLADRSHSVWWVENPERFIRDGLPELVEVAGEERHFLLLDEAQSLEGEDVRRLKKELEKHRSIAIVLAGRSLGKFQSKRVPVFNPDGVADRVAILEKVAEIMPAWAATARQLAAEPLQKARLIRILVVLARGQDPVPQTLEDLEEKFLDILVADYERIRTKLPGLAKAVMAAAAVHEAGGFFSRETLIKLADSYQPGGQIPELLQDLENNPRWQLLSPLMSPDPKHDTWIFHHDELAEGLLEAGGEEENRFDDFYGDDAWRRTVLDRIVRYGSNYSSSYALAAFVRQSSRPIIDEKKAIKYINQLLDCGNNHHAYPLLIIDDALSLDGNKRVNLLLATARAIPTNQHIWQSIWGWIRKNNWDKKRRNQFLEQLYQAGCRDQEILVPFLKYLPKEKAQVFANEWLSNSQYLSNSQHLRLICECLARLGTNAKAQALQFLEEPSQNPVIVCRCLELLGTDARNQALQLLDDPHQHKGVICRCLELLGADAKDQALQLLDDPHQHKGVICRCLELLGADAKDQALQLLDDPHQHKGVICRCLELLGADAKDQALQLLNDPHQVSEVICRCLELLGADAKDQALQLLDDPHQHKGVICRCLELLGDEAIPFAIERMRSWAEVEPDVLARCFQIAGNTPAAQQAAEEILKAWDDDKRKIKDVHRICALRAPFDTDLRIQRAKEVLRDWHRQYRPLVTAALTAFWNRPDAVEGYCRAILNSWNHDISYRHKHKKKLKQPYEGHIIKALAHPTLQQQGESERRSRQMLRKEERSPGFLSPELKTKAEAICRGEILAWSGELEDGISLREGSANVLQSKAPDPTERPPKPPRRKRKLQPKKQKQPQPPQQKNNPPVEAWKQKLAQLQESDRDP